MTRTAITSGSVGRVRLSVRPAASTTVAAMADTAMARQRFVLLSFAVWVGLRDADVDWSGRRDSMLFHNSPLMAAGSTVVSSGRKRSRLAAIAARSSPSDSIAASTAVASEVSSKPNT
ncbi:hypothetical protein D3C80_1630630 [compost metagenome]